MSDFLGIDIKLNDNYDIVITPDGNLEHVFAGECVAQDLKVALAKALFPCINNEDITIDEIKSIMKDTAFKEPRIDFDSVNVKVEIYSKTIEYKIEFQCLNYDTTQNLVFTNEEVIGGNV